MKYLKLSNRDGADLRLENKEGTNLWNLTVDLDHEYCLKYMRMGGDFKTYTDKTGRQVIKWNEIKMIDPAGGPYMEVGDKIDNYEIVKIVDDTILELKPIGQDLNS